MQAELALAFGALAVVSAAGWVRSMKLARSSEDIPTTKIRSAHQGYVEFFGMSRPPNGGVLRAPLSGRRCVWWSYQIVEYVGDQAEYKSETSREFFYIQDATGRCLIDHRGAELTPSETTNWVSSESPALKHKIGFVSAEAARYTVTESVLFPDVRLYVLGQFKSVRKMPQAVDRMREKLAAWLRDKKRRAILDVDKDGTLDDWELTAARRAAMIEARREVGTEVSSEDVVVKPDDDRPFIIAPRVQPTHVRIERKSSVVSLVACVLSLLGLAWALGA